MKIDLDDGRGQEVGSRIRLAGKVFGIELSAEEVVTERHPPLRKKWETIGPPRLLVVGHYRMGFELIPRSDRSMLRVYIEYELPSGPVAGWLGRLFGGYYARWCTRRMVYDAVKHFAPPASTRIRDANA